MLSTPLSGNASGLYPAAGLALAAVLFYGNRVLPSIVVAVLLTNYWYYFYLPTEPTPIIVYLVSVVTTIIQPFAVRAILLKRQSDISKYFSSAKGLVSFFGVALTVGAAIAPMSLFLTHHLVYELNGASAAVKAWYWWLGDASGIVVLTPLLVKWLSEKSKASVANLKFGLPIVIFTGVAWGLVAVSQHEVNDYVHDKVQKYQVEVTNQVKADLAQLQSNIEIVAELFSQHPSLSYADFNYYVKPFLSSKDWLAISYNQQVLAKDVTSFELKLSVELGREIKVYQRDEQQLKQDVDSRPSYMVVKYILPEANNSTAIGFDINSNNARKAAIDKAVVNQRTVMTDTIRLVQNQHFGALMITPLRLAGASKAMTDTVVGVIDIEHMISRHLSASLPLGWQLELFDTTNAQEVLLFGQSNFSDPQVLAQYYPVDFTFYDKSLKFVIGIEYARLQEQTSNAIYAIPLVNLVLLLLFCSLMMILWSIQSQTQQLEAVKSKQLFLIKNIQQKFIAGEGDEQLYREIIRLFIGEYDFKKGILFKVNGSLSNLDVLTSYDSKSHQSFHQCFDLYQLERFIEAQTMPYVGEIQQTDNSANKRCTIIPIQKGNEDIAILFLCDSDRDGSETKKHIAEQDNLISTVASVLVGINDRNKKQEAQKQLEVNFYNKLAAQKQVAIQAQALANLTQSESFISGAWQTAIYEIAKAGCEALNVRRFSIWLFSDDDSKLVCHALYDLDKNYFERGNVLSKSDYPAYFNALTSYTRISATDARSHPHTQEFLEGYLKPLNIRSMLDAGIIQGGQLKGVVCAEHVGENRQWLPEEENYVNIIAGLACQLMYSHERRQIKSKLISQQAEQSMIIDNMKEGVLSLDESGKILSFNRAAVAMFGYTEREILNQPAAVLLSNLNTRDGQNVVEKFLTEDATKNLTKSHEAIAVKKDKSEFPVRFNFVNLPHDGKEKRFLVTVVDVSLEKIQEKQLLHSQKMEALGQLTGGVVHDFNNILGIIMGYSELLKQKAEGETATYLEQILNAGDRARVLSKELLSFASKKEENSVVLDLNGLLDEKQLMIEKAASQQVKVTYQYQAKSTLIKVDPFELENAILNLIINAKHAMSGQGNLVISTSTEYLDENAQSLIPVPVGEYTCLKIKDSGAGIEPDILKRLFDPFFTTKGREGTGLGLAQVHGFIQRSQGTIVVESKIGEGTVFKLYFPVLSQPSASVKEDKVPDQYLMGQGNVLVVDDEKALTSLFELELAKLGYHVNVANSAEQAIDILHKSDIDVVLTDIMMPGKSGIDLARYVLDNFPQCKIQLMSGYSDSIDTSTVPQALYSERLTKPFTILELSKKLHALETSNTTQG
ncbi:CHASE domain-containing protein [Thalassotalea sp. LPB0316]|nr:CHASE domain-containing protein [Thalassotalea sp. LPB0316]